MGCCTRIGYHALPRMGPDKEKPPKDFSNGGQSKGTTEAEFRLPENYITLAASPQLYDPTH